MWWRVLSYSLFGLALGIFGYAGVWTLFLLALGIQVGHRIGTGRWVELKDDGAADLLPPTDRQLRRWRE